MVISAWLCFSSLTLVPRKFFSTFWASLATLSSCILIIFSIVWAIPFSFQNQTDILSTHLEDQFHSLLCFHSKQIKQLFYCLSCFMLMMFTWLFSWFFCVFQQWGNKVYFSLYLKCLNIDSLLVIYHFMYPCVEYSLQLNT